MDEEQRQKAILTRLMEMGIQVDKPIFTLIWQDVARVMVETEGFERAADFPTDVLVNMLNTIEDGLEYLDWYEKIQNSLRLGGPDPVARETRRYGRWAPGIGFRRPGFRF
jgi:hypothetical protein